MSNTAAKIAFALLLAVATPAASFARVAGAAGCTLRDFDGLC
jgi:hypothetical protein